MFRSLYLAVLAILIFSGNSALADCSPKQPEEFSTFFSKWSEDKSFATSRTIYPLKTVKYEYGEGNPAPTYGKVSQSDDTKIKPLSVYMKENSLNYRIESVDSKMARVYIFKESSDWNYEYHFQNRKGCWFFYKFEDYSL